MNPIIMNDDLSNEPLFEAVMISSFGQGLSFTTQGKRIKADR